MLIERVALPLLDRLRRSPYGGAWLAGAQLGLELAEPGEAAPAERLFVAVTRVQPWAGEPVDAWLGCTPGDLGRLLAGQAPEGRVGYRLGDRADAPARLMQARAVLGLAALGWCGPWPDPDAAPELVALTRRACLDLAIGPADAVRPLFAAGAPPELARLELRFTDGARRRWCTLGLSERPGAPELWTDADPRLLRVGALHWLEAGSLPSVLHTDRGALRLEPGPLPLPHGLGALVRITPA